jgi:alpha-glucosidase (family GH31 glycosyl hydrolase)
VLIWNDMNEPACFNNNEGTMPKTNFHTLPDGSLVEHRLCHSIYGFSCTKATSEGLFARTEGEERVFLLSRSYFAGS